MITGAIFDMDGTMFDTERLALKGWLRAAEEYQYPITEEVVSQIRGTNAAYSKQLFYELFGDKVDYELARERRTSYVNEYIKENGVPIKEGLVSLLGYLKERKIKMAVATSTHQELAEHYLKQAKVFEYFDVCVYGDNIVKGKPDPEIFLLAAKRMGIVPEECVVFEDSPHGIAAGKAAGCMVIAVEDLTKLEGDTLRSVDKLVSSLDQAIGEF